MNFGKCTAKKLLLPSLLTGIGRSNNSYLDVSVEELIQKVNLLTNI